MTAQLDLDRPAVRKALERASGNAVTLVVAPAGSGKSAAIGAYLATTGTQAIRFTVRPSHTSLSRFVRGLADTLGTELPQVAQSLAIAHERAFQSPRPWEILAAWVAEHLGTTPRTIVLDDYHHCEHDREIASFVASAIERTRATTRWIVATRTAAELPLAVWLARGDTIVPIDIAALHVTAAEAHLLARTYAPDLDATLVDRLRTTTSGAIGPIVFALRTAGLRCGIAERALDALGNPYERFADEALALLTPADRALLEDTAPFPDLDEALLRAAGYDDALPRIAAIRTTLPQAFEERLDRPHYKSLFADLLASRLAARSIDAVDRTLALTARALEGCGRIVESLAFSIRARDYAAIAKLVDTRGLALVETGHGDTVADAIGILDPIVQTSSPAILGIKAMFDSRIGRFDMAESWFQLAIDRAGDPHVRNRISYQYGIHLLRFLRPEAIGLFEKIASDPDVDGDLRCYALAALGPAYVFNGETDAARATVEEAIALLRDPSSPHLRARTFHQASFVALHRNDGARARELASASYAIASEHGFFDVAAGALTVLYNAASDIADDPVESLRLLDAVAECAAKSGSLVNATLALVAKLEIEVERGDEEAIAYIDDKLKSIDVRSSGRSLYEALLPSQALRASWTGDFEGAYRLLAASAELQWSADRKALRHAEIAVYAAAAKLRPEATGAIRQACGHLEALEPSPRRSRAYIFVALAMVLLGRADAARDMLDCVVEEPLSLRLDALRRTVEALLERYRGNLNHMAFLGFFKLLEERHFGGIARLVQTLPLTDNVATHFDALSERERRVLTRLAEGHPSVTDRSVAELATKLHCRDRQAIARGIARHAVSSEIVAR